MRQFLRSLVVLIPTCIVLEMVAHMNVWWMMFAVVAGALSYEARTPVEP